MLSTREENSLLFFIKNNCKDEEFISKLNIYIDFQKDISKKFQTIDLENSNFSPFF